MTIYKSGPKRGQRVETNKTSQALRNQAPTKPKKSTGGTIGTSIGGAAGGGS